LRKSYFRKKLLNKMNKKTELMIALDYAHADQALQLVAQLKPLPVIYKIGLELFLSTGPLLVKTLVDHGHRIFLDLKFYDIPNTVAKASIQAMEMGVEFFTLHISGGKNMSQSTLENLKRSSIKKKPMALGVSVLTSFDEETFKEVALCFGQPTLNTEKSVSLLAKNASEWGLPGIVCSAHELSLIKKDYPNLYTVVPGIRPKNSDSQDQARIVTPAEAKNRGASAIVVGRPITQSQFPLKTVESILSEIQ